MNNFTDSQRARKSQRRKSACHDGTVCWIKSLGVTLVSAVFLIEGDHSLEMGLPEKF
jgi:hypothetical protein